MNPASLYTEIYNARGYKIRFVWLKGFADVDTDNGLIRINLHKNNSALKNYVHELIHWVYPDMAHNDVYHWESMVWKYMSTRQKLRLYRKLFSVSRG